MESKYQDNKYDIGVYDQQLSRGAFNEDGALASGCLVFVYDAGTKTLSTLYSDSIRTSLANPITRTQFATDTRIKFYGAAASYDIVVCHSDGTRGTYPSVTPKVHSVTLDRAGVDKVIVF